MSRLFAAAALATAVILARRQRRFEHAVVEALNEHTSAVHSAFAVHGRQLNRVLNEFGKQVSDAIASRRA